MLPTYHRYAMRTIAQCLRNRFLAPPQKDIGFPIEHLVPTADSAHMVSNWTPLTPLRRSAGLRGSVYLAGAVLVVQGIGGLLERASITDPAVVQWTLLAVGTAWTYELLRLEGRPLSALPYEQRRAQALGGIVLGAGAFLAVAAVTGAQGWLRTAGWGWSHIHPATVVRSMGVLALTHAAYAWNEELVFRGYGYDVMRTAIGPIAAACLLTMLFALYHPWRAQVLFGEGAIGLALLALRIKSGDIWLPMGYHWAWNVIQTALLGPVDGPPSLLPLIVTGPYEWIGRPGYPEPGLLMAGVNLLVATVTTLSWWREQHG